MYPKYTTDAFIVEDFASGEADKMISFFTKDFGMIRALAKSVRMSKSKLKGSLSPGNFLSISLIKGKDIWRLTEAEVKSKIDFGDKRLGFFLRVLSLVKKLVHGEESNKLLFEVLEDFFKTISEDKFSEGNISSLECMVVVKMLDALGYGREEDAWKDATSQSFHKNFSYSEEKRLKIIDLINKSLKESHL